MSSLSYTECHFFGLRSLSKQRPDSPRNTCRPQTARGDWWRASPGNKVRFPLIFLPICRAARNISAPRSAKSVRSHDRHPPRPRSGDHIQGFLLDKHFGILYAKWRMRRPTRLHTNTRRRGRIRAGAGAARRIRVAPRFSRGRRDRTAFPSRPPRHLHLRRDPDPHAILPSQRASHARAGVHLAWGLHEILPDSANALALPLHFCILHTISGNRGREMENGLACSANRDMPRGSVHDAGRLSARAAK